MVSEFQMTLEKQISKLMRNIYTLIIALFCIGCQEEAIHNYIGGDYLQLVSTTEEFFSFVYSGSQVERDTVYVKLQCTGRVCYYPRSFKIEQTILHGMEYEIEDGEIIDSAFVVKPNQAVEDIHFVSFDNPELNKHYVVPPGEVVVEFPIILLRDLSLKESDRYLAFKIVDNENFVSGLADAGHYVLSDNLSRPKNWSRVRIVLGEYGKVKHQLLIDATGKPWDDEFILGLSVELQIFYKFKAVEELERINQERLEQGLSELREDENDPNSKVVFY